jgi:Domain of unknown function (DUF4832)
VSKARRHLIAPRFAAYCLFAAVSAFSTGLAAASATPHAYSLGYAPAPPDNPLKGFMPYSGSYGTFPYSMEWGYIPLRSLMTGPATFNWSSLDTLIRNDAARGHQTVFRVYLDYPQLMTGIPQYLLDAGLITYTYDDYGNNGISLCPDYENPLLDQALTNFIAALGARYDGDPRIGFVELGLLGYWGEWHTYPETAWFASVAVQDQVLTAYTNAFHQTKLLVRWPAGSANPSALPIGYHDDSFAYDTIAPPSYNFLGLLAAAGETDKWLTQPIGGEVRPEVQLCLWDVNQPNCVPPGQQFSNCVALTHASWMLNQGVFSPGFTGAQKNLALAGARQMGYELFVSNAAFADARVSGPLNVSLGILNTGVAPFYYDWPIQLGVLDANRTLVQSWTTPWKLSSLPPGTNAAWSFTQTNHGLSAGPYTLAMRVSNPMTNGPVFRFANQAQDADLAGWLTLGQFSVLPDLAQPTLSARIFPSDFVLQVNGAAPGIWMVEATSNFLTWTPLLTTNTSANQWNFTDPALLPARFYRVVGFP